MTVKTNDYKEYIYNLREKVVKKDQAGAMELLEHRGDFPIPPYLCKLIKELFDIDVPEWVSKDDTPIDYEALLLRAQEKWASTFDKLKCGDTDADKKYRRKLFNK